MTVEEESLGIIAHDLKEPLVSLRQLALSLDLDDKAQLARAQGQLVSVSESAIKRVNDMVKLARLEDGLFELEPVSVPAVCSDVVSELRYLYRENHKDLATHLPARSAPALANRELLRSIIYNFCTNALHYSDASSTATLTIRQSRGRIRVSIRDKGPALPAKIWRQLQQGWLESPVAIAMRPGSSGLGLYISSKFARFMGARVGAVRHRDGTSFYIDLPVSTQLSLF